MFCTKHRLKGAKWRTRCHFSSLTFLQQPHARMNYLRPMAKLWRARIAIMLKFILKTLLFLACISASSFMLCSFLEQKSNATASVLCLEPTSLPTICSQSHLIFTFNVRWYHKFTASLQPITPYTLVVCLPIFSISFLAKPSTQTLLLS